MKGQFTLAIIGIIFTITAIFLIALPLLVLKYHLSVNLKEEYDYNNAQLALLSLVSSKYNDTYSMYRVLSERNLNGFDANMVSKLENNLGTLTQSKCFRIVNESATVIASPNCFATNNLGEIYIFRPYNKNGLIEKIILVYQ